MRLKDLKDLGSVDLKTLRDLESYRREKTPRPKDVHWSVKTPRLSGNPSHPYKIENYKRITILIL